MDTTTLALAQAAAPNAFQQFLPLILILAVFYFLLIRPQQTRAKEHKAFVASLKKNDRVVTAAGLYGRVIEVREKDVTLEIAPNVQVRHVREQIGEYEAAKKES
jgi:preprotein translocase subunit YajC